MSRRIPEPCYYCSASIYGPHTPGCRYYDGPKMVLTTYRTTTPTGSEDDGIRFTWESVKELAVKSIREQPYFR